MENVERLKQARSLLLKLHKRLIDEERLVFERFNGPLTAGQFLNVLLENESFAWLRKFSMLIVEIDEMFDLKDGITDEMVNVCLAKSSELVEMRDADERFNERYRGAIEKDRTASDLQNELRSLLAAR